MAKLLLSLVLLAAAYLPSGLASLGDSDPAYLELLETCSATGCGASGCIPGCAPTGSELVDSWNATQGPKGLNRQCTTAGAAAMTRSVESPWALKKLKWDCYSECQYQSMEAHAFGSSTPVKYYGRWFKARVLGVQEPAAAAASAVNLVATLGGVLSLLDLTYRQLPRKTVGDKGPVYEYTAVFTAYGLVQANAWFWSTVFHARNTANNEVADQAAGIALLGFALIAAIIRIACIRVEAARVMVGAPIIAFMASHICFLAFIEFHAGWNFTVCGAVVAAQLLCWTAWAVVSRHPASWKVLAATAGGTVALAVDLLDFPPVVGGLDAHAIWHAATIPLTLLWWSFLLDDAKYRTRVLVSSVGGKRTKAE